MLQLPAVAPKPLTIPTVGAVLLADPDPAVRGWIQPALSLRCGPRIQWVSSVTSLERALLGGECVSLVVANAKLGAESSLRTLARVRSQGCSVPWIVYTAFAENLMRILLSDVNGEVLSSRVVDLANLAEIGNRMARRPQSTA